MQARCPHCTSVFTTERTGVQFCPTCGRQIHVPEPRAPGAAPPSPVASPEVPPQPQPPPEQPPQAALPPPPPPPGAGGSWEGAPAWPSVAAAPPVEQFNPVPTDWERRGEVGFFAGYFRTLKRELFSPDPFWRSVRPDGSLWDALSFGWLTTAVYLVLSSPLTWLQFQFQTRSLFESPGMEPEVQEIFQRFTDPRWLFGGMALVLLLYPISFFISAAVLHVACLIFGAARSGFTATARAIGYSTAPLIVGWVPCLGGIVAGVYNLVLEIWGLARIHRTDVWRPIVAYLTLLLVAVCCTCGIIFAVIGAAGGFK